MKPLSHFYILPGGGNLLMYFGSSLEVIYEPTPKFVTAAELTIYLQGDDFGLIRAGINISTGKFSLYTLYFITAAGL